ncbi:MAG: replication-associated recombination protein A [Desulfocapsa sp.]|uniref:Replication-associated recombination protein A n=1 Tax=Desulfotalea psychrophila TaxID=84980 RepID=A0ABS3ATB5_9BACT|nr:replication-associated recombination protein A [Desulfocapsa sp.]MBN4068349.1 replication-associated recombination protein A [Desulfotalea psychrophila]
MKTQRPLAERMRPQSLNDIVGQKDLLGKGKLLDSMLESGTLPSLILWGPPGTGKTTLARILARSTTAHFVYFSAVLSGVKEVRKIVAQAEKSLATEQRGTIFFIDEIHRFNKSQQDALLPHVESGLFTLIGATTENPSFQVIAPLLSRCRVLILESLSKKDLAIILDRALNDREHGLGKHGLTFASNSLEILSELADGDARNGLNTLDIAATIILHRMKTQSDTPGIITKEDIIEAAQQSLLRYDKGGEEHYNLISALHKSLRDSDPDGSLYWLYRMLESGEDPLYICRRLIRFASEDIGLSDPQALVHTMSCRDAYHTLGLPEGKLAIAQAVTYLATAPKSNSLYTAESKVRKCIHKSGSLPVPLHLRNAPTKLMKDLNYGKDYRYAHDCDGALVAQDHLPIGIQSEHFYTPSTRGYEALIKDRLQKWQAILQQRKNNV